MKAMKRLSLLIIGVLISNASISQTTCSNATEVVNDPADNTINCLTVTGGAVTDGTLTGAVCAGAPLFEGWYSFTIASGPQNINVLTENYASSGGPNARNVAFEVLSGACPGGLTSIACINDNGAGASETTDLFNLPNGTYYVRVYSINNGTIPDLDICITATAGSIPATNDDCANAIPVAVGAGGICTEVTGTNIGATDSGVAAPGCSSYGGGDVWFSAVVPASGNVTFASDYAAANSLTDIGMALYTGTCGSLTETLCDDDSGNGLMSSISATGLTPGSTVFIRVWEYGNDATGDFDLCFSEPPLSDSNQDCESSTGLCTSSTIGGSSDGDGNVVDLNATNQDCLSTEHESSWFDLEIATAGTFEFVLSPSNGSDDYDFAIWVYPGGVGQGCPPAAAPDRCSFAAGAGLNGSYDTGLGNGAVDASEDASGDNWVSTLNLNVGDVIVILIDNFSSTTSPFTVDFPGTAGLDCTVLPVELLSFYAEAMVDGNRLHWKTESEMNNDYFTVEHSKDAQNWRVIGNVNGAGTTDDMQKYALDHDNVDGGVNYYKLYQTDMDGSVSNVKIISINNDKVAKALINTINLLGQEVDSSYTGVVIDLYTDGTSVKRLQ